MASLVAKARMTALKSQEDFAPLLGVSVVTLCKYEQNPRQVDDAGAASNLL